MRSFLLDLVRTWSGRGRVVVSTCHKPPRAMSSRCCSAAFSFSRSRHDWRERKEKDLRNVLLLRILSRGEGFAPCRIDCVRPMFPFVRAGATPGSVSGYVQRERDMCSELRQHHSTQSVFLERSAAQITADGG